MRLAERCARFAAATADEALGKPRMEPDYGADRANASVPFYWLRRWDSSASEPFPTEAIPGSSLKGALRSMVEALTNDRFGAVSDRDYYEKPIPYRTDFTQLPHLQDFIKLHTYPQRDSVRYYPVNWSQYTWMPVANKNPGDPESDSGPLNKRRPNAMSLAAGLQP